MNDTETTPTSIDLAAYPCSTPFAAAITWRRLGTAQAAIQSAVGMEHPTYVAVSAIRTAVWSALWDMTDRPGRDDALDRAAAHLAKWGA